MPIDATSPRRALAAAFVAAALACVSCSTPKPRGAVLIRTPAGSEQGVTTPLGTVFLARTAQQGPCDVTIFFGDGPSIEPGRIAPIQDGLARVDLELKAPWTELSMYYPTPEDDLVVGIASERDVDFYSTHAATGVNGTAVDLPSGFPTAPSSVGAGVFRREDQRYRLVGLVTGVARFVDASGKRREVLTYLGPKELLPLWIENRDRDRAFDPPRRDDIQR